VISVSVPVYWVSRVRVAVKCSRVSWCYWSRNLVIVKAKIYMKFPLLFIDSYSGIFAIYRSMRLMPCFRYKHQVAFVYLVLPLPSHNLQRTHASVKRELFYTMQLTSQSIQTTKHWLMSWCRQHLWLHWQQDIYQIVKGVGEDSPVYQVVSERNPIDECGLYIATFYYHVTNCTSNHSHTLSHNDRIEVQQRP